MSRLDHATEIADLAADLGLAGAANPVEAILRHCRSRIDRWVAQARGVTTISQLEALVTQRLQMVFEEVRSDADFARITDKYARGKKDFVFAAMRVKFEDGDNLTYGALVRRKNVAPDAPDRCVAVIDCRGGKLARRFFTRWHEIAHRLTTDADEPQYRSEHGVLRLDAVEVLVGPDLLEDHLELPGDERFQGGDARHAADLLHPAVDAPAAEAQDGVHGVGGTAQAERGGEVGNFRGLVEAAHSSSRNSFTAS